MWISIEHVQIHTSYLMTYTSLYMNMNSCNTLTWILHMLCRVGVKLPTVEVRYKNLCVEAECKVVHGRPLPTLWNSLKGLISVSV